MNILTLVPAYGRDYKSAKEAQEDWKAGKDFQIADLGPYADRYTSSRDAHGLKATGYSWLNIRYRCLSRVAVVRL